MQTPEPVRELADENYHEAYPDCAPGTQCVGELRHELLVNPVGEQPPDHAPVKFSLACGDGTLPLRIIAGGVSGEKAELLVAPLEEDAPALKTNKEVTNAPVGMYTDRMGELWVRTNVNVWVRTATGELVSDRVPFIANYNGQGVSLASLELTPWRMASYDDIDDEKGASASA